MKMQIRIVFSHFNLTCHIFTWIAMQRVFLPSLLSADAGAAAKKNVRAASLCAAAAK